MKMPPLAERLGRDSTLALAGAFAALTAAVLLFVRWGINGRLSRDEAIYTYSGQQLAHGVAPYVSMFDVKGPGASMTAGVAAGIAHLFNRNDVYFIRFAFFLMSLLTIVAIYLLALRLWRSVTAAVVAAVVFACFTGFAEDALNGPDAKTPGIAAVVFAMWFAARRQWFLAGFASGVGFLVWQPLIFYPIVVALVAMLTSERTARWRALARAVVGSIVPFIAVSIYFLVESAFGKFIEAAFLFPLTEMHRNPETLGDRLIKIAGVVHGSYGVSGALLWLGMAGIIAIAVVRVVRARPQWRQALADPLICIVLVTMLTQLGYAAGDFQGYPDVYPFLPYGAIGMGGLAAVAVAAARSGTARRVATSAVLGAALALAAISWVEFGSDPGNNNGYRDERAYVCGIQQMMGPTGGLYTLGDSTALVITHRRNPDRYIYLGSGVDHYRIKHEPGAFAGWTRTIQAANPAVVVMSSWHSGVQRRMVRWLQRAGFTPRYLGPWRLFLSPAALQAADQRGIRLERAPSAYATDVSGHMLPPAPCR